MGLSLNWASDCYAFRIRSSTRISAGNQVSKPINEIPAGVTLGVVAGILIISVIASMAFPRREVDAGGGHRPSQSSVGLN